MTCAPWNARPAAVAAVAALAALLLPTVAAPCGAFYGAAVEVDPDQTIVLVHRGGIETYVFQPRFCGAATDFGVILPVPSTLTTSPSLASAALFDELDRYTAPTIEERCGPTAGVGCGAGSVGDGPPGSPPPVDVIDQGQVGIFDWSLVQATSVAAFTDWLGANGYPYDAALADAYQHYVSAGWYFVAFKVTAGAEAPPEGTRLCGDLGPIRLSFASPSPIVPARITGVNASGARPHWRIFLVAPAQQRLLASDDFYAYRHFSGLLEAASLGGYPELSGLSQDGERLTGLDVFFQNAVVTSDIGFQDDPAPADYRSTTVVFRDCSDGIGCEAGGAPAGFAGAAAGLALLRALRRRREDAALD